MTWERYVKEQYKSLKLTVLIFGDRRSFIQRVLKWDKSGIRITGNIFWDQILVKSR